MKSKVVMIPCENYEDGLAEKLEKAMSLLGGIESLIGREERITVKTNILNPVAPEKAITTHPAVFGAMLSLLKNHGYANVTYGDTPTAVLEKRDRYQSCGLRAEGEKYGYLPGDYETQVNVSFPQGKVCREFPLCREAAEADAIICVCKMKTHAMQILTGAVKNQYGFLAGQNKTIFHAKFPSRPSFAQMLCDLNLCLKPRLYLMDGIVALEGNGPGAGGDPTPMKVMLLSTDPVALDATFARLVYLKPEQVPTCLYGAQMGLGTYEENAVELLLPDGETISCKEAAARFGNPHFLVRDRSTAAAFLSNVIGRKPGDRPVVDLKKCIACGVCEGACPVEGKAVHSGNGKKAKYDYQKCIRCYCCQEMCPVRAISKK